MKNVINQIDVMEKSKSRRVKINFETINKGKYTVIDPKLIAESYVRISKAMKEFKRKNRIR